MNKIIVAVFSWLVALWTCYVFLGSLAYKFTDAAEPIHIFNTIGTWMSQYLGAFIGELFSNYGAYIIGTAELVTSLVLLSAIIKFRSRRQLHLLGASMAIPIMAGAIFFHLATPLGWIVTWEENGTVFTDAGLANAALSIFLLNIAVVLLNRKEL